MRISDPKKALDYPKIPDDKFIIWVGNEFKWPDGRRETRFLTDKRKHIIHGFDLLTTWSGESNLFDDMESAIRYLDEQNEIRKNAVKYEWGPLRITSVKEMKELRGYSLDPITRNS